MLTSIIHLYVLLFFMTQIMHGQSSCSCNQTDSDFANGINLIYQECNDENTTITYPATEPQHLLKVLQDKRTIFYIHGYLEYPEDPHIQMLMKALCHGKTDNVVLLDWSKYSKGVYATSFQKAEKVGSLFARSLQSLVENGLDVSKIYIVGHSLGSHIAGLIGKCNNNFVIPRITALDPANPFAYLPGCYLTPNDAAWVDVIHTDKGGYGSFTFMGTAHYYVNGGSRPQPGCKLGGLLLSEDDLCSHKKSFMLYAKSKLHPTNFTATQCSNYVSYQKNYCKDNKQTGFGYAASNIRGTFYLNTEE